MITVEALARRIAVPEAEIIHWVDLSWLRPRGAPGAWHFDELDEARVRLIAGLRALALDEEAMSVVLSLLDQLHATRSQMRLLLRAIDEAAPDAVRARLAALLMDAS